MRKLIVLGLMLLLFTGCYDYVEINEMAIVYGNRYRINKEVDLGLTKAEMAFYKGNFKNALEQAIVAINIIEPGIHKRLIGEYQ